MDAARHADAAAIVQSCHHPIDQIVFNQVSAPSVVYPSIGCIVNLVVTDQGINTGSPDPNTPGIEQADIVDVVVGNDYIVTA